MKKLLLFLLLPVLSYGQVQIGDDIDGEAAGDNSGFDVSLSDNGLVLAISAPLNSNSNGINSGYVRIYEFLNGSWNQIGSSILGEEQEDFSGTTLSLSSDGNIVAIGSRLHGNFLGQVRIFENINGEWIQVGSEIEGNMVGDESSEDLVLSSTGNIVVIGSQLNDTNGNNSGQVRIFENINNEWIQKCQNINGTASGDRFGGSLSTSSDGNIIAVGARNSNINGVSSGQVKIFEYQDNNWVQRGQNLNGETTGDIFGTEVSLSLDGEIVAISAFLSDGNGEDSGQVKVYQYQDNGWIQIGNTINGEAPGDQSGLSLGISNDGSVVAIGAPNNDGNGGASGHFRLYKNQSGFWEQIGQDVDGEEIVYFFGSALSLSGNGNIVAVSGDIGGTNAGGFGRVKVYDFSDLLSIQEHSLTIFSLYPNPTKNNLTINLSESDTLQKATIYNSLGQEVLQSTQTNIDVSSLSKGVYVVEVQTSTGKGSEKLIIN